MEEELINSSKTLKTRKAPGPDSITPKAVKMAVATTPKLVLAIMNDLPGISKKVES